MNIVVFVGTDITHEVELLTNSAGRSVIFYEGHKYLRSGESKLSYQYRCCNYMKQCKSKIIFNRENETISKNEIGHNHEYDPQLYENALKTAVNVRRFGKNA